MSRLSPQALVEHNILDLIDTLLPQECEPEQVHEWSVGAPCVARGEIGRIDSLDPGCASVSTDSLRTLFVGIDELKAPDKTS